MEKVLFFFTASYPYGNEETFIENEIQYLSKAFEQVYIITSKSDTNVSREVPSNVTVIQRSTEIFGWQKLSSFKYLFYPTIQKELFLYLIKNKQLLIGTRLNYLIKSFAKGVIISTFIKEIIDKNTNEGQKIFLYSYWWLDESIGISIFKKTTTKSVVAISRAHGYDIYSFRQANNYLPLKNFTLTYLDKLFTISSNGAKYLTNNPTITKNNLSKIEVSRLGTNKPLSLNDRNPEKTNDNTHLIVSCSSINPNKRVGLIAETLVAISNNYKVKWVHIGDFSHWVSEEFKNEVNAIFEKANKCNNLTFKQLPVLKNKDVITFYQTNPVKLFINLSESEGIPVSIMEAMSCRIPVIATDAGGTREIVSSKNGLLLGNNPTLQEITNGISNKLKLTVNELEIYRTGAFETWDSNYNASKNYGNFVNKITSI